MSVIEIGKHYKLSRHPATPIGKVIAHDKMTQQVTVEWDDKNLMPSTQQYAEWEFLSAFEPTNFSNSRQTVFGGDPSCFHRFEVYHGFNQDYEFCTKCNMKRYNQ